MSGDSITNPGWFDRQANRIHAALRTLPVIGPHASLLFQYVRFGIVGLTATGTHATVLWVLHEEIGVFSLLANLIGFCCGFVVSFLGHLHFTFRMADRGGSNRSMMVKFLGVALTNLAINTAIVWTVVEYFGWSLLIAIGLMIVATPLLTFALAKFWAFRED